MTSVTTLSQLSYPAALAQPWQQPIASARLKDQPADFVVEEVMDIDFSNDGEHLWVQVQKTGLNTSFVAQSLAKWAGIPIRDVGFSGLKDRHAITTQWFSLRLPNKQRPQVSFTCQNGPKQCAHILTDAWHRKKLNRGTHGGNRFTITLTDVVISDASKLHSVLDNISQHGVPNYFGQQRFGRQGNNLSQAHTWLSSLKTNETKLAKKPQNRRQRDQQSLWLSAARSAIFNQILAKRVADGSWQTGLEGEVFNLHGSKSVFSTARLDEQLTERLHTCDIHPTGALWGRQDKGSKLPSGAALLLEQSVISGSLILQQLATGLHAHGVQAARRPLRLLPQDITTSHADVSGASTLTLGFTLPAGSFATSVLYSLVHTLA